MLHLSRSRQGGATSPCRGRNLSIDEKKKLEALTLSKSKQIRKKGSGSYIFFIGILSRISKELSDVMLGQIETSRAHSVV